MQLPMAFLMPGGHKHVFVTSVRSESQVAISSSGVIKSCITRYARPECAHGSPDVCMESSLSAGVFSLALLAQPLHPCLLCRLRDKLVFRRAASKYGTGTSSVQRRMGSIDKPSVLSPKAVAVPCFDASAMLVLGPLPLLLPRPFLCSSANAGLFSIRPVLLFRTPSSILFRGSGMISHTSTAYPASKT